MAKLKTPPSPPESEYPYEGCREELTQKGPKGTLKLPGSLRRAHLDRSPRYAEGQSGGCSLERCRRLGGHGAQEDHSMGAELQDSWTLEILEYAKYHTGRVSGDRR